MSLNGLVVYRGGLIPAIVYSSPPKPVYVVPEVPKYDATKIAGTIIDDTGKADGKVLSYDEEADRVVWATQTGGVGNLNSFALTVTNITSTFGFQSDTYAIVDVDTDDNFFVIDGDHHEVFDNTQRGALTPKIFVHGGDNEDTYTVTDVTVIEGQTLITVSQEIPSGDVEGTLRLVSGDGTGILSADYDVYFVTLPFYGEFVGILPPAEEMENRELTFVVTTPFYESWFYISAGASGTQLQGEDGEMDGNLMEPATYVMWGHSWVKLICDGTNWYITSEKDTD